MVEDVEQDSVEPQMDADGRRYQGINAVTEKIIGAAMRVSTALGPGFLEKPYENALAHELRKAGVEVEQQKPAMIMYDGVVVGEYLLDLLVERQVVVELKACKGIDPAHVAQTINYLKATHHNLGLILNFGNPKLQVKRLVHQL
jgi:GxxExxY protein